MSGCGRRKSYRRLSVIAVDRNEHSRFLMRCEYGHKYWQRQTVRAPRRRPMNDSEAHFYANWWRPGQGCYGECPECTKEIRAGNGGDR
jgi:hypothetical protein